MRLPRIVRTSTRYNYTIELHIPIEINGAATKRRPLESSVSNYTDPSLDSYIPILRVCVCVCVCLSVLCVGAGV
jgi:hypothetical protein